MKVSDSTRQLQSFVMNSPLASDDVFDGGELAKGHYGNMGFLPEYFR